MLDVRYAKHQKEGKLPTLRVDYDIGEMYPVSEWQCLEHTGYALQKACAWWTDVIGGSVPFSVDEAIQILNGTSHKMPRQILCARDPQDKFWQIKQKTKLFDSVPVVSISTPSSVIHDDDMPF